MYDMPTPSDFVEKFLLSNAHYWKMFNQGEIDKEGLRFGRFAHALGEAALKHKHLAVEAASLFTELCPQKQSLMPGAKEVLEALKQRGYTLHIITNGFETSQNIKLVSAGIAQLFSSVTTSESSGYRKPQTAFFELALAKASCASIDGVVIGDNPETDIKGAIQSGMASIWYNPDRKQAAVEASHTIFHLESLLEILP